MPAYYAYNVDMKKRQAREESVQYTVRDITPEVDRNLRRIAEKKKSSLNGLINQILTNVAQSEGGGGPREESERYHDLDFAIGSWVQDDEFDCIVAEQDKVDKKMWK